MMKIHQKDSKETPRKESLRAPKCTRCRNHGVVNDLRGHKHKCFWRECVCEKCIVSSDRQRATADRIALFRQQVKEVTMKLKHKESTNNIVESKSLVKTENRPLEPNITITEEFSQNIIKEDKNQKEKFDRMIKHDKIFTMRATNLQILKYVFPFYNDEELKSISRSYNHDVLQSVLSISKNVLENQKHTMSSNQYSTSRINSPSHQYSASHTTSSHQYLINERCCDSPYCPMNSYLLLRAKNSAAEHQSKPTLKRGYNMIEDETYSSNKRKCLPLCGSCYKYGGKDDKFCSLCGLLY